VELAKGLEGTQIGVLDHVLGVRIVAEQPVGQVIGRIEVRQRLGVEFLNARHVTIL